MYVQNVTLEAGEVYRLLSGGSGDAALVLLCLRSGCPEPQVMEQLHMSQTRYNCACALLRQLDLWPQAQAMQPVGERPNYSQAEVTDALTRDPEFSALIGEVQRSLGRVLSTEELKIFLGFRHYLGMPTEVVQLLVRWCMERSRRKSGRLPSIRTIEKEAYRWAEHGVDTMEEAAAYIQTQNARETQLAQLLRTLQISGRNLTPAEQRYADSWLDMGFQQDALALAYEKTCLATGGLKWPYMNKILQAWHQQNLHTAEQVRTGDRRPQQGAAPRTLDQEEKDAIARMLRES